jgi:hypothetical protein
MRDAVAERASAIRHYLRDHEDTSLVRKYFFLAARYEQLPSAIQDGNTTPAEDATFREVTDTLLTATKKLGLGDSVTGRNGSAGGPQRFISDSWVESARLWFP